MSNKIKICTAHATARRYNLADVRENFSREYDCEVTDKAVICKSKESLFFCFSFGVIVFWNVASEKRSSILKSLGDSETDAYRQPFFDDFEFSIDAGMPFSIRRDHINLPKDDELLMLAVSYGIAQSATLDVFEYRIEKIIDKTAGIPKKLAHKGSMSLGAKEVAKIRGQLYLERSYINLHYDLLETPDYIWEHPEYDEIYATVTRYLEIKKRTEVLDRKLIVIHDLFEMLSDEQKHKHSSMLEWIIILLILYEVLFALIEKLL